MRPGIVTGVTFLVPQVSSGSLPTIVTGVTFFVGPIVGDRLPDSQMARTGCGYKECYKDYV